VLNLSLLLDGRRPLSARVERLERPVVELVALDLDARRTLRVNPAEGQRLDPRDPLALHLAALRLVGLFGREPLAERLRRLGGGLRVTTAAAVPKGSGLGASSILAAALLATLHAALGWEVSPEELCPRVLQLEQLMGTGGGWQDQVGGMWGGVKYAVTDPGIEQQPRVETIALDAGREREMQERLVLFYTGEPRLAKDVLQRVVGSYLVGSPATLAALAEMPALARAARQALLEGDWPALGACLDRSWALNREIEPTSTNDSLDALFARIAQHVLGAKLAGAGGGGFLFALARDGAARERLEQLLAEVPPPARLYRATLDRGGLVVAPG
jgi:fucokinase